MDAETAQQLYDASLALLLSTVRQGRRGLYRVMMAPEGLIQSVAPVRASASARNPPSAFTLFVPGGDDAPPRLGPLDALSPLQRRLAELLLQDTQRLLRAAQVAYALQRGDSPVLRAYADSSVQRLVLRFGALPEPALKREDEAQRARDAAQQAKERERAAVWDAVPPTVFDELLRREHKLEEKRRHKKLARAAAAAAAREVVLADMHAPKAAAQS